MNVFSNFVPRILVKFNDNDAPFMVDLMKNEIKSKHQTYKNYIKNGCKGSVYIKFQAASSLVSEIINWAKDKYQNHIASS